MRKHLLKVAKNVFSWQKSFTDFFILFINRKYFSLILKTKTILISCTGKFCYRHSNCQNATAAIGVVFKNFTKFTRKHLCRVSFLINVFSCELCEIFKNISEYEKLYMIAAVQSYLM